MDIKKSFLDQEDIIGYLKDTTGLPKDQLEVIINNLWGSLRGFITDPLETRKGIMLNTLGNFYINPYSIQKKLDKIGNNPAKRKELYIKLIEQLKNEISRNS